MPEQLEPPITSHVASAIQKSGATQVQQLDTIDPVHQMQDNGQAKDQKKSFGGASAIGELNTGIPPAEHAALALRIIDAGGAAEVASNFEKFTGIPPAEHAALALRIIERGGAKELAINLNKFMWLDMPVALALIDMNNGAIAEHFKSFSLIPPDQHIRIAEMLIDHGRSSSVAQYLYNFTGVLPSDHSALALRIIAQKEHKDISSLVTHLKNFKLLNLAVACELIDAISIYVVTSQLELFANISSTERSTLALKLIDSGDPREVFNHQDYFTGLNLAVALALTESSFGGLVARLLGKLFTGIVPAEHAALALKIIEHGGAREVAQYLDNFFGIPTSEHAALALKIIEHGGAVEIVQNLGRFTGIVPAEHAALALKIIEHGGAREIIENLNHFYGILPTEQSALALKIIEQGDGQEVIDAIYNNLLSSLDGSVAVALSSKGFEIIQYLNIFIGLSADDYDTIAMDSIRSLHGQVVADNLGQFNYLRIGIANFLINSGHAHKVVEHFDKFSGIPPTEHTSVAMKIIEEGYSSSVAEQFDKFTGIPTSDHAALAMLFIAKDFWGMDEFISSKLKALDQCAGAYLLHCNRVTKEQFAEYPKPSSATLAQYISLGCGWTVAQYYGHIYPKSITPEMASTILTPNPEDADLSLGIKLAIDTYGQARTIAMATPYVTLHDTFISFSSIEGMRPSTLSVNDYYHQILAQVVNDTSTYIQNDTEVIDVSWQKLNEIAWAFPNKTDVMSRANQYVDAIPELKPGLIEKFAKADSELADWKSLKAYFDLAQLVNKAEVLKQFAGLNKSGQEKLYRYVAGIALHPDSSVNLDSALALAFHPEKFFGTPDAHSGTRGESKKPSRWCEIPYLPLAAADIRDALVDGQLDSLQTIAPMQVQYDIYRYDDLNAPLHVQLVKALGSKKNNVAGSAKNTARLFGEVKKVLGESDIASYLDGSKEIPDDKQAALKQLLYGPENESGTYTGSEFGVIIPKPLQGKETYVVTIHRKDDPQAALAGNDTACCMPFGSGKMNLYMANPNCAILTVRKEVDGRLRTVAQSVVTLNREIGVNVSDVIAHASGDMEKGMGEIIKQPLSNKPPILACDNIEVARNASRATQERIVRLYIDFMHVYAATQPQLDTTQVIVGKGYTPKGLIPETIPNTTIPAAPIAYSDNYHSESYVLRPKEVFKQKRIVAAAEPRPVKTTNGVGQLGIGDVIEVARLEGKIYGGTQLEEGLVGVENTLIANAIYNKRHNLPDMSAAYRDSDGAIRAYIISYEGQVGTKKVDTNKFVYVADLAAEPEHPLAAGKLILDFVAKYEREYLAKGVMMPIFAHMRETTSYKLFIKQLGKLKSKLGIEFEVEEGESQQAGKDNMHPVMIRPRLVTHTQ